MHWLSLLVIAQAATAPLLRKVADVPLPGAASRFDYASLDPGSGRLYLNHMGAGEVVVFDIRARKVVAVLKGFPRCTGILAVPALDRIFVSTPPLSYGKRAGRAVVRHRQSAPLCCERVRNALRLS